MSAIQYPILPLNFPSQETPRETPAAPPAPTKIVAVDIGGTKIKVLANGDTEPRKLPSGRTLTPARMVQAVKELAADWEYEAVSIGYPGLVGDHGPRSEPVNLGSGWVGFNFGAAFGKPVRIINDAAMQALGSYDGGRMLFLGLGTGLGSALIAEKSIVTLELGCLFFKDGRTLGEVLGRKRLEQAGKRKWRVAVAEATQVLMAAFLVDNVVLGGGNAKLVKELPSGVRLGHNLTAFRGGFRLWHVEDVQTLVPEGGPLTPAREHEDWRLL